MQILNSLKFYESKIHNNFFIHAYEVMKIPKIIQKIKQYGLTNWIKFKVVII